jgi:wyosine [tRNA(Phe)-imidazoG37] synthetase (radical SAM superfamily)
VEHKKKSSNLYGPVPSRRLGFSLGIDFIPFKKCTLDCIYCQLGHTPKKTVTRKTYVPASKIWPQIVQKIDSGLQIDFITFSGSGEPTLNTDIGKLIRKIKKNTDIPVAVLTNGTLLQHADVRKALLAADLVIPSLDAATQDVFEKINRPHPSLRIEGHIAGLKKFRQIYQGQLWLEVLLVKGINDSSEHLKTLKAKISEIDPDKVQLNTVVRPPAEKSAHALSQDELESIKKMIGGKCEIIAKFGKKTQDILEKSGSEPLLAMVRRRPMTLADLATSLGFHRNEVLKHVQLLLQKNEIQAVRHKNKVYYEPLKSKKNG